MVLCPGGFGGLFWPEVSLFPGGLTGYFWPDLKLVVVVYCLASFAGCFLHIARTALIYRICILYGLRIIFCIDLLLRSASSLNKFWILRGSWNSIAFSLPLILAPVRFGSAFLVILRSLVWIRNCWFDLMGDNLEKLWTQDYNLLRLQDDFLAEN